MTIKSWEKLLFKKKKIYSESKNVIKTRHEDFECEHNTMSHFLELNFILNHCFMNFCFSSKGGFVAPHLFNLRYEHDKYFAANIFEKKKILYGHDWFSPPSSHFFHNYKTYRINILFYIFNDFYRNWKLGYLKNWVQFWMHKD